MHPLVRPDAPCNAWHCTPGSSSPSPTGSRTPGSQHFTSARTPLASGATIGAPPPGGVVEGSAYETTGFAAPVGGGVRVESLQALAKGFRLMTSAGEINARVVVVCTGHPSARTSRPGRPAFRPGCQCSMRPSTTTGTTTARTGADRRQRAGRVSISGGTAPGRSRRVPVLRPRAMGAAAGTTRTPLSGSPGGVDEPDPGRPAQPGGTADG